MATLTDNRTSGGYQFPGKKSKGEIIVDWITTTDHKKIASWAPLLVEQRDKSDVIAATRIDSGTDVNFGAITQQLFQHLESKKSKLHLNSEVKAIRRVNEGWHLTIKNRKTGKTSYVESKFVMLNVAFSKFCPCIILEKIQYFMMC